MIIRQRLTMILALVAILNVQQCKDSETEMYSLTVNDGEGSGEYAEGAQVTITANEPAAGQEFVQWSGETEVVTDAESPSTTVRMPARDVTISATYNTPEPVTVSINQSIEHQTMDGFGFFGGRDVWWSSPNASHYYSDDWLEKIITDLGITMWRNELYPHIPPDQVSKTNQDASWDKQKDLVIALKEKADEHNVDLKVLLTVWSPPSEWKWEVQNFSWAGDDDATRAPGNVSEKNGGTLSPDHYADYGNWWNQAIQMYEDVGVNVYAVSLQNEPMFKQQFNSSVYTSDWYEDLIANVAPIIKEENPEIRIFGSENMLEMEGRSDNYPYFYHTGLKNNAAALQYLDIFAVHGYQDGVSASSGSALGAMWSNHKDQFVEPSGKKAWMTETSGYGHGWEKAGETPGAFALAIDIQTAINFGDVSGWVWWQGSDLANLNDYNLMSDLTVGKKYYASKNFYRYIRPGAIRVEAAAGNDNVAVSAFKHPDKGTFTILLTNTADESKNISLSSESGSLPETFEVFVTSADKNCEAIGTKSGSDLITIPARSVVTLQAGGTDL